MLSVVFSANGLNKNSITRESSLSPLLYRPFFLCIFVFASVIDPDSPPGTFSFLFLRLEFFSSSERDLRMKQSFLHPRTVLVLGHNHKQIHEPQKMGSKKDTSAEGEVALVVVRKKTAHAKNNSNKDERRFSISRKRLFSWPPSIVHVHALHCCANWTD
jgi:hypothetical protein